MEKALTRPRAQLGAEAAIDGWMDDDVASAATQLFSDGPHGALVVDARELLTSTARVVGAQMGELHLKVWMAIVTLYVASGMPADGKIPVTVGELSRIILGADRSRGGKNTRHILRALFDLYHAEVTVPGYDVVNGRPTSGASVMRLLITLHVDETMLKVFEGKEHSMTRRDFGADLGAKQRGTVEVQLHPTYTERLAESDLRRFDWAKAQQLRGVALALWMVFTSPRVPYRATLERTGDYETVQIPLTLEHCHALGVHAATDAARRRTLNEAGKRVCAADRSFVAFEAYGRRGHDGYLKIVRTPVPVTLEPAAQLRGEQLVLDAAA